MLVICKNCNRKQRRGYIFKDTPNGRCCANPSYLSLPDYGSNQAEMKHDFEEEFDGFTGMRVVGRVGAYVSLGVSQTVLLAEMLNNLPENRPLYKDSGLWQIRSDDMKTVIFEQNVNDSFEQFISRVTECLDES